MSGWKKEKVTTLIQFDIGRRRLQNPTRRRAAVDSCEFARIAVFYYDSLILKEILRCAGATCKSSKINRGLGFDFDRRKERGGKRLADENRRLIRRHSVLHSLLCRIVVHCTGYFRGAALNVFLVRPIAGFVCNKKKG